MSLWAVDVSGKVIVKRRRSMLRIYADSKEEAEEKAKRSFIEKQKNSGALACIDSNVDLIIKMSRK